MSLTAGTLSRSAVGASTVTITATAATSGSSPYTYQLYQSTVSGFLPSAANAVAGATSLVTNVTGLASGAQFYYKQVAIDSAAASVTTAQVGVVTATAQSQNQFLQSPTLGMPDMRPNHNTMSAIVDISETSLTNQVGTWMKLVATSYGVMKVVACTAVSDNAIGPIVYNAKDILYPIGSACEVSTAGDVLYLISVGAISAGAQVEMSLVYVGAVKSYGTSGSALVGWAIDAATADGQLIRVKLVTPSFTTHA